MSCTTTASFPPLPVVLVLGASGMLGRAVYQALRMSLATQATVVGTAHSRMQGGLVVTCDVTNEASLRELLASQAPQVVINCVAERRPDVVEKEPAKADVLNVRLVEILGEESARLRFYLVHISTDYVFDGTKPPYKPYDPPHPLNVYGKQKLAAEDVLRRGHGGVQVCWWKRREGKGKRRMQANLDESEMCGGTKGLQSCVVECRQISHHHVHLSVKFRLKSLSFHRAKSSQDDFFFLDRK